MEMFNGNSFGGLCGVGRWEGGLMIRVASLA